MDINKCETCEHNQKGLWCKDCEYMPKQQTRYARIMQDMTVEWMAELRTVEWIVNGEQEGWINDTGKDYIDLPDAIAAEIEWLKGVDE